MNKLKKFCIYFTLFVLAVCLSGCNTTSGSDNSETDNNKKEEAPVGAFLETNDIFKDNSSTSSSKTFIDTSLTVSEIKENYGLYFCDDFDTFDFNYWKIDGNTTTYNNELQSYAASLDDGNIDVSGGYLNLIAKKESRNGKDYTSAKLITRGKLESKFGIFEISAKLPEGKGVWPAFWLLGEQNGLMLWPVTGEIDVMEFIGSRENDNTVHATYHYGDTIVNPTDKSRTAAYTLDEGKFSDGYHVFGLIWTDSEMLFYVDDTIYARFNISSDELEVFRKYNNYIILNLAIGGNWPGKPNADTVFPSTFSVDYVKVYKELKTVTNE